MSIAFVVQVLVLLAVLVGLMLCYGWLDRTAPTPRPEVLENSQLPADQPVPLPQPPPEQNRRSLLRLLWESYYENKLLTLVLLVVPLGVAYGWLMPSSGLPLLFWGN